MADDRTGIFPLYPGDAMQPADDRNAASGRSEGPGAEPLPFATGKRFILSPEDAARRVTIESDAPLALYDGRNQAQNGWFVLRSMLPFGWTGTVVEWKVTPQAEANWLRTPVIAHSQLGYAAAAPKLATVELDRNDRRRPPLRLIRIGAVPENHEDWPFFWGENEYVIPEGAAWIELANAANRLGSIR